jgi:O-antigen/teichoic acid export membrane protein
MLLSLPIAAGTFLIAGPLTKVLYGHAFDQSVPVLQVLALCVPAMYLNIMVNQVLVASERQTLWTKVMLMATILNPILNLLLIRYFQDHFQNGAIGSAIALLLTELVIAAIALAVVRRSFDWSSINRLLRGAVATLAMSALVLLARSHGLFIEVIVGMVTFPAFAALLRVVTRADYREMKALLESTAGRIGIGVAPA